MKKLMTLSSFMSILLTMSILFTMNSCSTDPCEDVTCQNQGVPTKDGDNCNCACTTGFEGDRCQTEVRAKFVATYRVVDACSPGFTFNSSIATSATNVSGVLISNILGSLGGSANATVTDNTITIPSQTVTDVDGDAWTVVGVGVGTLVNNSFTITVQATFGTQTLTCQYTFTKQ